MYTPTLALGKIDIDKDFFEILLFLEDIIKPGVTVGTGAYTYPYRDDSSSSDVVHHYLPAELQDFYAELDTIGDYVIQNGGGIIPLQSYGLVVLPERRFYDEQFAEKANPFQDRIFNAFDNSGLGIGYEPSIHAEYLVKISRRLDERLNVLDGVIHQEEMDTELCSLTKQHEPTYLIVEATRLPALMIEFPDMPIQIA